MAATPVGAETLTPPVVDTDVQSYPAPVHDSTSDQRLDISSAPSPADESHQSPTDDDTSDLDLITCEVVRHEVLDVPGVSYRKYAWTPIGRYKGGAADAKSLSKSDTESLSESDCDNLCFPDHDVVFHVMGSTPGLMIKKSSGSNVWTPIAARTRNKTSQKDI